MNPYIRKISSTNLFVLPILGIGREKLLKVGFVEAFIKDELRELEFPNCIYLLFRPTKWAEFNMFLEEQRKNSMPIVDEYDHSDGWAIVVYQYDTKWQKDIDVIMTGKYSQVTDGYKNLFPKYYQTEKDGEVVQEMTNQHLIFNKAQEVKDYWKTELDLDFQHDDEVWHYYTEREILNEDSLKRLTTKI